jgi:hypothetical protein
MNWAAWEYRVGVQRRKEMWSLEVTIKPGTKRHIWSSEDALRAERVRVRCPMEYSFKYGGAMTGRMSGKSVAAMMAAMQNLQNQFIRPLLDNLYDHMADALVYGTSALMIGNHAHRSHGMEFEKVWFDELAVMRPRVKHEFTQRTGEIKWPEDQMVRRVSVQDPRHPHRDFVRSLNATSSSEPARSRPATNWRGRGKPSRTRRRFIT